MLQRETSIGWLERRLRRLKLSKRFGCFFLLMSIVPLLVLGLTTYYRSSFSTRQRVAQYCLQINKGLRASLDLSFEQIEDYSIQVAYDREFQSRLTPFLEDVNAYSGINSITQFLKRNVILHKDSILQIGMRIMNPKDKTLKNAAAFDIDFRDTRKVSRNMSDALFARALDANGSAVWGEFSSRDTPSFFYSDERNGFQISRAFSCMGTGDTNVGVLSLLYSSEYLSARVDPVVDTGDIYLVAPSGRVIYSNRRDVWFQPCPYLEEIEALTAAGEAPRSALSKKGDVMLTVSASVKTGWQVVYVAEYAGLVAENRQLLILMCNLVVLLILAGFFLTHIFSASITLPIQRMIAVTNLVRENHLDVRDAPVGSDELAVLSQALNEMIARIDELISDAVAAGQRERDFRFRALQAQINPHFLYNVLDGIRWTARQSKDYAVDEQITQLAKLFRLVLSNGEIYTDFASEIQYTRYYLHFQQSSYRDLLHIQWDIDDRVLPYSTIKLLLQPLAENCIIHAMRPDGQALHVQIKVVMEADGLIRVSVSDDGVGMDAATLAAIQAVDYHQEGHIALYNVNERIREYYGAEYALCFESREGEGTTVSVRLPAMAMGKERTS